MSEWIHGLVQHVVDFAGAYPALIGLLIFLFASGEGIAIVGAALPGESIVVALAAIAGAAGGDPWLMLLWATAGAAAGDGISFWIGRTYGVSITRWPGFRSRPELLEKGHDFIRKHGVKSVAIARFLPVARSIVPIAAGVFKMDARRFYIANIASALAWSAVHIFPAVALGFAYKTLGEVSGRIAALVIIAFVLVALLVWMARATVVRLAPYAMQSYALAVGMLAKRSDNPSKYLASVLDPNRPGFLGLAMWSIVLLVAVVGSFGVLEDLISGDPLVLADVAINNFVQGLRNQPVDGFMVLVTSMGDSKVLTFTAATLVITLLFLRAWRLALATLLLLIVESTFVSLMKLALHKARPIEIYSGAEAFSFPSGHSTATTVIFGALAVLISRNAGVRGKASLFSIVALWVALVGISRIYLSAHWPSDVIGGVLFGTALIAIFALLQRQIKAPEYFGRSIAIPVTAVFIAFGGYHAWATFDQNISRYAPRTERHELTLANWTGGDWLKLPLRRIDLGGEREEPFGAQWASSRKMIADVVEPFGWKQAGRFTWLDAAKLFSPGTRLEDLTPLPILHDGKLPSVTFVQTAQVVDQSPDERLVWRFWPTEFVLVNGQNTYPIFLASLSREVLEHPVSWLAILKEQPPPAEIPAGIVPSLAMTIGFSVQRTTLTGPVLIWKSVAEEQS